MSCVKSAFDSMVQRIKDNTILNMKPEEQNKKKEVRYSKKNEFTEKVIEEFSKKKIELNKFKFDERFYINPFILEK